MPKPIPDRAMTRWARQKAMNPNLPPEAIRRPASVTIQIEQLGLSGSLVEAMVVNHLPDLERKRYPAIAKALGASVEAVVHATKIIEGLEPKPGRPFYSSDSSAIIPDVYVVKSDGAW